MRFAAKMVLGTCIITALSFSVGGIFMIKKNYEVAYQETIDTNTKQHIRNRYLLESNILNSMENGVDYSEDLVEGFASDMDGYGDENEVLVIYDEEMNVIYKNIQNVSDTMTTYMDDYAGSYRVYEDDGSKYMLLASDIEIGKKHIILLNQFDISSAFVERDRQIRTFMCIDAGILVFSFVLVGTLSRFLTKNIKKLSATSTQIAGGDYGRRTNIISSDEIGELSHNFDQMAEAVEDHVRQLEKSLEIREQFVSDFSHELKTPMTSMMGYSRILLNNNEDEETRMKSADYIYRECRRLERLSKTMLKMMGITEETIDRKRVYTNVLQDNLMMIQGNNMKYSTATCELETACIMTDENLLETLLRNLMENADHACEGRTDGKVIVIGYVVDGSYEICIKDNGCGIEAGEIPKLTEAFYMVDKSRSRKLGGSGLGLAICSKICQTLEIVMKIESEPNAGTDIILTIPGLIQKGGIEDE